MLIMLSKHQSAKSDPSNEEKQDRWNSNDDCWKKGHAEQIQYFSVDETSSEFPGAGISDCIEKLSSQCFAWVSPVLGENHISL